MTRVRRRRDPRGLLGTQMDSGPRLAVLPLPRGVCRSGATAHPELGGDTALRTPFTGHAGQAGPGAPGGSASSAMSGAVSHQAAERTWATRPSVSTPAPQGSRRGGRTPLRAQLWCRARPPRRGRSLSPTALAPPLAVVRGAEGRHRRQRSPGCPGRRKAGAGGSHTRLRPVRPRSPCHCRDRRRAAPGRLPGPARAAGRSGQRTPRSGLRRGTRGGVSAGRRARALCGNRLSDETQLPRPQISDRCFKQNRGQRTRASCRQPEGRTGCPRAVWHPHVTATGATSRCWVCGRQRARLPTCPHTPQLPGGRGDRDRRRPLLKPSPDPRAPSSPKGQDTCPLGAPNPSRPLTTQTADTWTQPTAAPTVT